MINRLSSLLMVLVLGVFGFIETADAQGYTIKSFKKGNAGAGDTAVARGMEAGVAWYYGWNMNPNALMDSAVEYVPMKQNKPWPSVNNLANCPGYSNVLCYNEPWHYNTPADDGDDPSPAFAADFWLNTWTNATRNTYNYSNNVVRLGSPNFHKLTDPWELEYVAYSPAIMASTDYITTHTYPGDNLPWNIKNIVDGYFAEYGKPLWLTEFNVADWSGVDSNNYYHAKSYTDMYRALHYMELEPKLERYSIFAWGPTLKEDGSLRYPAGHPSYVTDIDGNLTPLGLLYANMHTADAIDIDALTPNQAIPYYIHNRGRHTRLRFGGATPELDTVYNNIINEANFNFVGAAGGYHIVPKGDPSQRLRANGTTLEWSTLSDDSAIWTLSDAADFGLVYIRNKASFYFLDAASDTSLQLLASSTANSSKWCLPRANFFDPIAPVALGGGTNVLNTWAIGMPYSGSVKPYFADNDAGMTFTMTPVTADTWLQCAPDGTLSGTPDTNSNATADVNMFWQVIATDIDGLSATNLVRIKVIENTPAEFTVSHISLWGKEDVGLYDNTSRGYTATDTNGHTKYFTVTPIGTNVGWLTTTTYGKLGGVPRLYDVGTQTNYMFNVTDGFGITNSIPVITHITGNDNDAPFFTSTSLPSVGRNKTGYAVSLWSMVDDPDWLHEGSTELFFSTPSNDVPAWMTIQTNGLVTVATTPGAKGVYTFYVKVQDGTGKSSISLLDLEITQNGDPAAAPTFGAAEYFRADATEDVAYNTNATETINGTATGGTGPITYRRAYGPGWLQISADGVLSGTPGDLPNGTNTFTIMAEGADGAASIATLHIYKINVNDAPKFTNKYLGWAYQSTPYSANLNNYVYDVDDDPLTISLISAPAWMSLDAGNYLVGDPAAPWGSQNIEVSITDGEYTVTNTLNTVVFSTNTVFHEIFNNDPLIVFAPHSNGIASVQSDTATGQWVCESNQASWRGTSDQVARIDQKWNSWPVGLAHAIPEADLTPGSGTYQITYQFEGRKRNQNRLSLRVYNATMANGGTTPEDSYFLNLFDNQGWYASWNGFQKGYYGGCSVLPSTNSTVDLLLNVLRADLTTYTNTFYYDGTGDLVLMFSAHLDRQGHSGNGFCEIDNIQVDFMGKGQNIDPQWSLLTVTNQGPEDVVVTEDLIQYVTDPDSTSFKCSLMKWWGDSTAVDSGTNLVALHTVPGTNTYEILVEDAEGGASSNWFTYVYIAEAVNDAPVFSGAPVDKGQSFATIALPSDFVTKEVSDEEGDPINYAFALAPPAWFSMDTNGVVTAVPGPEDLGDYSLSIIASDGLLSTTGTLEFSVVSLSDAVWYELFDGTTPVAYALTGSLYFPNGGFSNNASYTAGTLAAGLLDLRCPNYTTKAYAAVLDGSLFTSNITYELSYEIKKIIGGDSLVQAEVWNAYTDGLPLNDYGVELTRGSTSGARHFSRIFQPPADSGSYATNLSGTVEHSRADANLGVGTHALQFTYPGKGDMVILISIDVLWDDTWNGRRVELDNLVLKEYSGVASTGYVAWAESYQGQGDNIGLPDADYDFDGYANWVEYALNGDPTNPGSAPKQPVSAMIENNTKVLFIHNEHVGQNSDLTYILQQTPSLTTVAWTNVTDAVTADGPIQGDYKTVTNMIPTAGKTTEFIRLLIRKD
ncbi:MAG TPA: glycosyl hydrolase [Pontiella sp.]